MKTNLTLGEMLTIGGLLVALSSYIFALEKRITLLELKQEYSHGDVTPYLAKER